MSEQLIRWAYHLDKTKVGTTEAVDADTARLAVEGGRAAYATAEAPAPAPAGGKADTFGRALVRGTASGVRNSPAPAETADAADAGDEK